METYYTNESVTWKHWRGKQNVSRTSFTFCQRLGNVGTGNNHSLQCSKNNWSRVGVFMQKSQLHYQYYIVIYLIWKWHGLAKSWNNKIIVSINTNALQSIQNKCFMKHVNTPQCMIIAPTKGFSKLSSPIYVIMLCWLPQSCGLCMHTDIYKYGSCLEML